ncbi:uncharacterized protein V6R79_004870 [Siganus canaliculatus]
MTAALLFPCILISVVSLCHGSNLFFNDNSQLALPSDYNIAWMSGIQDFRDLSLLTIPGTHSSVAFYGGVEAEHQAYSLNDQLLAGIRFLDLTVFAWDNTLYVMNGIMYQHSNFKGVLSTVQAFLSQYPTEAVLIRVKPSVGFEKNTVNQMVQALIGNDQNIVTATAMQTLGQIRGKIVFLQSQPFTLGIPVFTTNGKDSSKVSHVKDKENSIIAELQQSAQACGFDNVVVTYTSGTGFGTLWGMFLTPKSVAEQVDPWLNQYLRQFYNNQPRPCFGVIAMDFPGFDLIQTVVNLNF